MQKRYRLKSGKVFDYLHRRGQSYANKLLVLVYAPSKYPLKAGFIVSKKVGKAHVRNKTRRRLREAFRALIPFIRDNHNYIVIARQECGNADFYQLSGALAHIFTKQELWAKKIDDATAQRLKLSVSAVKASEKASGNADTAKA